MKGWVGRRRSRSRVGTRLALTALILLSLAYLLAPPTWMLISSISPDRELRDRPPHWVPRTPTLEHYRTLFQLPGANAKVLDQNPQVRALPRSFLNSVTIAAAIALNLADAVTTRSFRVCFSGFGVGLTWSAMLMQLGPLQFCRTINYP